MLERIEEVDLVRFLVPPTDTDIAGAEHLAQLVADEIDDGLEVELGRHPLLDAVDDRELGGALLGFLQQMLRLVEEARVLERDAHARGDRAEQAYLSLAERVFALVVLDDDRSEHTVTADDRDI